MGTFEKLGILVIVVIIVMISAVAVYQWGGPAPFETQQVELSAETGPEPLIVRDLGEVVSVVSPPAVRETPAASGADTWPGGVPKAYEIRPGDVLWKLVVQKWGLPDAFVERVKAVNAGVRMERLRPGDTIVIPDPSPYVRGGTSAAADTGAEAARVYSIQTGDSLESIARTHLGDKRRWPEIRRLNPGVDPRRLRPGQELKIPAR